MQNTNTRLKDMIENIKWNVKTFFTFDEYSILKYYVPSIHQESFITSKGLALHKSM